jgi:hypothetical protein
MYTSGLIEEIRVYVELQRPRDLEHACNLARAYEKKATRSASTSRSFFLTCGVQLHMSCP